MKMQKNGQKYIWPFPSSTSSHRKKPSVKQVKRVKDKKALFGCFFAKTHTTLSIFCPNWW
jgi:hypothetical protein